MLCWGVGDVPSCDDEDGDSPVNIGTWEPKCGIKAGGG